MNAIVVDYVEIPLAHRHHQLEISMRLLPQTYFHGHHKRTNAKAVVGFRMAKNYHFMPPLLQLTSQQMGMCFQPSLEGFANGVL